MVSYPLGGSPRLRFLGAGVGGGNTPIRKGDGVNYRVDVLPRPPYPMGSPSNFVVSLELHQVWIEG